MQEILLGQYWTDKNSVQCCTIGSRRHCTSKKPFLMFPWGSTQQCTGKRPVQCCLKTLWTTMHRLELYLMLSERFQTTLQKKLLCNVFLILLGQDGTGQNSIQCCPRCSRQHFIRKNSVQFCLNTVGTTLHRSKPYAMLSEMIQATLHKKKSCSMSS